MMCCVVAIVTPHPLLEFYYLFVVPVELVLHAIFFATARLPEICLVKVESRGQVL
jgi:hypothetical protein